MSCIKVNIRFDESDESYLSVFAKAHAKVIFVKHNAHPGEDPVSWVDYKPWLNNTIDWENAFSIYASKQEEQRAETVDKQTNKKLNQSCG